MRDSQDSFFTNSCIEFEIIVLFHSEYPEAVVQRCSVKNVFLRISQNSQKNTCVGVSFFTEVTSLRDQLLKRYCTPEKACNFIFLTKTLSKNMNFFKKTANKHHV